jgi:curved DNA-binding protein CbpA
MPPLEASQNHYDLLGVRPSASIEEIRRRYKFLVIAFHPDRFVRTPEHHALAELRIKQVNEAYRVLSDPQARAQYDLLRLAAAGNQPAAGYQASAAAPWLAQMQHDLEQAHTRIAQLEQEIGGWRARLDAAASEKTFLQQAQAERERQHQQARLALDAEVSLLTQQLEQLARERTVLDARIKEQATTANQKTAQLSQELASRERLVENLAATKAEWEKSNQSRQDLLVQQVRKLQEDVARRDKSLAQQNQAHITLQERLARVEQEAHLAQHSLAHALRSKQQELDNLLAESGLALEAHNREQRSVRLWQVVALIAILNTLLLLVLLLIR